MRLDNYAEQAAAAMHSAWGVPEVGDVVLFTDMAGFERAGLVTLAIDSGVVVESLYWCEEKFK